MNCPVCDHPNADDARFCGSCGTPLEDESAHVRALIGQTIGGRYLVKRVIGEGGMGVVYEAEQQMGPAVRTVAVKTLLPWMSKEPSIRSRFYREGGIVSALEHPNTVRVYDFGEAPDGRLYIAMEFVRGQPLTALIERGAVDAERTKRILRQVCGALEEAHQQGIIHRDLKPDNIILTSRSGDDDFVKVLDFGIAARTGPAAERQTKLTKLGMVLGTPPYMSPEQLAGKEVDARSDVYSLGIIAYEMLTGRLPFEADTPWQWANKHMTEEPRRPTTVTDRPIPPELEGAVMAALAKNPQERPRSAIAFYRMLNGELSPTVPELGDRTTPMPAPPDFGAKGGTEIGIQPQFRTGAAVAAPIPPPPTSRQRRRGRWVGWALGLTGLAALAGSAVAFDLIEIPARSVSSSPPITGAAGASPVERDTVEIAPLIPSAGETPEPAPEPTPEPKTPPKKDPKPPTANPPTLPGPVQPPPVEQPQQPPAQPPPAQPPPAQPPPAQPPPAQTPPERPRPSLPTPPAAEQPKLKLPGRPPPSGAAQGDAACAQASTAAQAGNIEGAVSLYRTCASTGGSSSAQATARAHIRRAAPGEVKRRGFNGNCQGAKSAANAAASIGEGGPAQAALAETSCR